MDAAANGRSSNDSNLSLQLGPKSLFNAFYRQAQTLHIFEACHIQLNILLLKGSIFSERFPVSSFILSLVELKGIYNGLDNNNVIQPEVGLILLYLLHHQLEMCNSLLMVKKIPLPSFV